MLLFDLRFQGRNENVIRFIFYFQVDVWRTDESLLDHLTLSDVVRIYGIFREVSVSEPLSIIRQYLAVLLYWMKLPDLRR